MDLQQLFRWTQELEILGENGDVVVLNGKPLVLYQRVIGDADLAIARKHALKASRILRGKLRDKETDEHLALLPSYGDAPDQVLRNMALYTEALDLRRRALDIAEQPRKPTTLHSEASLEDQEDYEAAMDKYYEDKEAAVTEKMRELTSARDKELQGLSKEALVEQFLSSAITSLCQTEMLNVFNSWCTYMGTYRDKKMKIHAFSDYDNFNNSAPELKSQVIAGYLRLEVGGGSLKN